MIGPYMKPCWSCGVVDGPCVEPCVCARCIDPSGYAEWRSENPGAYADWMARNVEDEDEAERWQQRAYEADW